MERLIMNQGINLFVTTIAVSYIFRTFIVKRKELQKLATQIHVSCPGKILVAGGYLVLEKPNVGLTITGSSRFHSNLKFIKGPISSSLILNVSKFFIYVDSPQFYEHYIFEYDIIDNSLKLISSSKNEFVFKCLSMTLSFIRQYQGPSDFQSFLASYCSIGYLYIILQADNDFYSHISQLLREGKELKSSSLQLLPEFCPCEKDESGKIILAKTGLGSSAALTTSFIAALLCWFGVVQRDGLDINNPSEIIHNLAQLVHANAQGKIGSGFDVASAVYGTQLYTRFSQDHFISCLEDNFDEIQLYQSVISKNGSWDQSITPFRLPPLIDILLCDISGGSNSPAMAKAVMKWKESNKEEAESIWNTLAGVNLQIYKEFQQLNSFYEEDKDAYFEQMNRASNTVYEVWGSQFENDLASTLCNIRALFQQARLLLKYIGENSNVEIEPSEQTQLADATLGLPGVLAAGVPGAGGNDALFCIVINPKVRENVENLWSTWNDFTTKTFGYSRFVCPLMLHSENEGIKINYY